MPRGHQTAFMDRGKNSTANAWVSRSQSSSLDYIERRQTQFEPLLTKPATVSKLVLVLKSFNFFVVPNALLLETYDFSNKHLLDTGRAIRELSDEVTFLEVF